MLLSFRLLRALPLLSAVLLAGCAVTAQDCDPRNADMGFGTKLGCSTRGVYAERIEQKEKILLDEQQANKMFRAVYEALEQEKREVGQQRRTQQNRHAALNRAISALLAEVKDKAKGNQQIEAKIADLERDLATMRQQPNPSVLQKQHELQKLQEQVTALEGDLGLR